MSVLYFNFNKRFSRLSQTFFLHLLQKSYQIFKLNHIIIEDWLLSIVQILLFVTENHGNIHTLLFILLVPDWCTVHCTQDWISFWWFSRKVLSLRFNYYVYWYEVCSHGTVINLKKYSIPLFRKQKSFDPSNHIAHTRRYTISGFTRIPLEQFLGIPRIGYHTI